MHARLMLSRFRSSSALLGAALLSATLAADPALAQDAAEPNGAPAGAASRLSFSLTAKSEFGLSADLDDDGEVSTTRVGADFGVRYRLNDRVGLGLGLGAEYSFYDFDDYEAVLGGGEPIDDAFLYSLTPTISFKAGERWTLIGGGIFRWAGEEDADLGDAFTAGAIGAANYKVNDRLSLGFGFIVASRLEDDSIFIPALTIDWKINDRWTLTNESRPGLALQYQATERLELSVEAFYTTRDYRLNDDNAIPEGAMEDTRVPVAFAASWRALDRFTLTGKVGTYAYQKFEFRNEDGDEVDDVDADPSLFFGLEAKVEF
jgi:hypothetical protein